jgi:biopolymer transport protein ExbB
MYPLLVISIVGLAFILERAWAYKQSWIDAVGFINRTRDALLKGGAKAALAVCEEEAYAGKPATNVVKGALLKFDEPLEELEKTLENSAVVEVGRLEKFLWILATVANVAPIVGFLGTVSGMINSFASIAKYGLSNPNLVARGISEALITTASGLTIAMFAQPAYNFYSVIVARFIREMEASSNVLLETHSEIRKGE